MWGPWPRPHGRSVSPCRGQAMPGPPLIMPRPSLCGPTGLDGTPAGAAPPARNPTASGLTRRARRMFGRGTASPPRSGQKPHVSQRRGDPLGRPRSFMPTRLFMAGTNKSRGVPRGGGRRGRRRIRARHASPLLCGGEQRDEVVEHGLCLARRHRVGVEAGEFVEDFLYLWILRRIDTRLFEEIGTFSISL